jgi:hypothetical protein
MSGKFSELRRPPAELLFEKEISVQGQTFKFKFRKMELLDWQNALGRGARLGEIYGWEPDPEKGGILVKPSKVVFDNEGQPIQIVAATCETIGILMGAELPKEDGRTSFEDWVLLASIPEANEQIREIYLELKNYRPAVKAECIKDPNAEPG